MNVFSTLCSRMVEVLPKLADIDIKPTDSLRNLCPNSVDRMDILLSTLEELNLNIPLTQLHGPKNLQELVDLLQQKMLEKSEMV